MKEVLGTRQREMREKYMHVVRRNLTNPEIQELRRVVVNGAALPPKIQAKGEVTPADNSQPSRYLKLIITPDMWKRLKLMAAQTHCPAATNEFGKVEDSIGAVTPEIFAAELLEVAILEAWNSRGMGKVRA